MEYLVELPYKGRVYRYFRPKKRYMIGQEWKELPKALRNVRLSNDLDKAIGEALQLKEALDQWRAGSTPLPVSKGSFTWLIGEYKKSDLFSELGKRTQKEYGYILEAVKEHMREKGIEDAPADEFTRHHAKLLYKAFSATKRKAQLVASISRIVFRFGMDDALIKERENPFSEMRIRKNKPRQIMWLDIEAQNMFWRIEAMKAKAIEMGVPSIGRAMDLALFSMQRQSDLLALAWNRLGSGGFTLKQRKTGALVFVPIDIIPAFAEAIKLMPRLAPNILISERTDNPYTKDHFGEVFREVRLAAGINEDFKFMDMRRTGVVLYAIADCNDTQITSISGHTNSEVSDIIETYLPRNSLMAKMAAEKLAAYMAKLQNIQTGVQI